ncbi:HAD-IC family P-type ATPase [Streptomyces sp. NPDC057438]|uniref:HAD-IC family P-type ATPase n=1 Tax=Streptomyces sp. NPDC057438 TaxID=3346133 RepID=UPI0036AA3FEA
MSWAGSTTVICSDKTGTLTENQMTVQAVWTPQDGFTVSGSSYVPEGELHAGDGTVVTVGDRASQALFWCLSGGALCSDAALTQEDGRWQVVGDPTEAALLVSAAKAGLDTEDLAALYPRVDAVPFGSERQSMATLHRARESGEHLTLVKGAAERVVGLCTGQMSADGTLAPVDRDAALRVAENLAVQGLRVLATAMRSATDPVPFGEQELSDSLVLTGMQAMLDPPRAAAADAVHACHTAGVTVKMITGDHVGTATAIAYRLGLLEDRRRGNVLTGAHLEALPVEEYPETVDRARVLARVSPEQKLRLVEALQARGQVVAMTGDGVNDAPALRQANIRIAMGRGGTEVAKEAADMVLTDDDFATIEAAVEEGRGVFDNLTKFIVWVLPTSLGQGLVILFGTALPILPTQILWINMTTAVLLGPTLAFEPKEAGIMHRPPRDPGRPLLTGTLAVRILLVSALIVGGAWWLFAWEQAMGAQIAEARTAAVNLVVAVELFYLFSCRPLTRPAWRIGVFSNRWIAGGVVAQTAGQLALTYLPTMNSLFRTAPIGWPAWLRILALGSVAKVLVTATR